MRMVGSSCFGVIHTARDVRLNATFARQMSQPGSVVLCSQSGSLGVAIISLARSLGLGLSAFITLERLRRRLGRRPAEYWEEMRIPRCPSTWSR
jgi:acyl-CoA synthetase (NDP forming)